MVTVTVKEHEPAARLFRALSDDTRLRILQRLSVGEQCVCELTDAFQTGQSRLSFHLKVLKDARLVNDRPEGRWMYYSLNRAMLEELEEFIVDLKQDRAVVRASCP